MDDLPDLVYEIIFKRFFTVNERIALRLVCKKWKQLIEFFGQESLAVCPKLDSCKSLTKAFYEELRQIKSITDLSFKVNSQTDLDFLTDLKALKLVLINSQSFIQMNFLEETFARCQNLTYVFLRKMNSEFEDKTQSAVRIIRSCACTGRPAGYTFTVSRVTYFCESIRRVCRCIARDETAKDFFIYQSFPSSKKVKRG